jgi:hypothetical protein
MPSFFASLSSPTSGFFSAGIAGFHQNPREVYEMCAAFAASEFGVLPPSEKHVVQGGKSS